MATATDPFRELGVPRSATPREVQDAWMRCCGQYDPDHFRDAPDRVRERAARRLAAINDAYAEARWTQIVEHAPLVYAVGDGWDVDAEPTRSRPPARQVGVGPRLRKHRFDGFDRVENCCLARCRCGWVGPIAQSEDRARLQFVGHVTRAWTRRDG